MSAYARGSLASARRAFDWQDRRRKAKKGLEDLVRHIHSKGMDCGAGGCTFYCRGCQRWTLFEDGAAGDTPEVLNYLCSQCAETYVNLYTEDIPRKAFEMKATVTTLTTTEDH